MGCVSVSICVVWVAKGKASDSYTNSCIVQSPVPESVARFAGMVYDCVCRNV